MKNTHANHRHIAVHSYIWFLRNRYFLSVDVDTHSALGRVYAVNEHVFVGLLTSLAKHKLTVKLTRVRLQHKRTVTFYQHSPSYLGSAIETIDSRRSDRETKHWQMSEDAQRWILRAFSKISHRRLFSRSGNNFQASHWSAFYYFRLCSLHLQYYLRKLPLL